MPNAEAADADAAGIILVAGRVWRVTLISEILPFNRSLTRHENSHLRAAVAGRGADRSRSLLSDLGPGMPAPA